MVEQTQHERILAFQRGASIAQANDSARRSGQSTFVYNNQIYAASARGAFFDPDQQQPTEGEARNIPVNDISTQSCRMLTQKEYDLAVKTGQKDSSGVPYVATKHYGFSDIGPQNIEQLPGKPPRLVGWQEGQLPVSTLEGVKTIQRQELMSPMSQGRGWQWGDTLPLTPYQRWAQGMQERTVGIFPKGSPAQAYLRGGSEWERSKQGLFKQFGGKETYVASSALDWSAGFTVGTLAFANTVGELSLASMGMRGGRPEYVGQYIREGFIDPIYQDITRISWSGDAQSRIAQLALLTVAPYAAGKFAANAALLAKGRPMWEDVYVKHGKAPTFDMTIKGPIVKTSKGTLVTVESVMEGSYKATGAKTGQPVGKGDWRSTSYADTFIPKQGEPFAEVPIKYAADAIDTGGVTIMPKWWNPDVMLRGGEIPFNPTIARSINAKVDYITKSHPPAYNSWGDTVIPEMFWREPVITKSMVESKLVAVRDIRTITDQTFVGADKKVSRLIEGSTGEGSTFERIKIYGDRTVDMFRAESMTGYPTHAKGPVFEYGSGRPVQLGERSATRGGQVGTEFLSIVTDVRSGPDYTGEISGKFFATKEQLNALKGVFDLPTDPVNRILRSGKHTPFDFTGKATAEPRNSFVPSGKPFAEGNPEVAYLFYEGKGAKTITRAGSGFAPADVSGSRAVQAVMPTLEGVATMAPSKVAIPRGELKSLPGLFSVPESMSRITNIPGMGMKSAMSMDVGYEFGTRTSSKSAMAMGYKQASGTKSSQMMDVSTVSLQIQRYTQSPKQATSQKTVHVQQTEVMLDLIPKALDVAIVPKGGFSFGVGSSRPFWLPNFGGGLGSAKKRKRKDTLAMLPHKLDYAASLGGIISGKSLKRKPSASKAFMPTEIRLPVLRGIGL